MCVCVRLEAKQQVARFDTADCRSHPGSKVEQQACKYCTVLLWALSVSKKVRSKSCSSNTLMAFCVKMLSEGCLVISSRQNGASHSK